MIRQVFTIKFSVTNYINPGIIHGRGSTYLVSKKYIGQNKFYSTGSSSSGKRLKKVVYATGALVLSTGGLVLYAKNDAGFQSWLNENIPGYDSFNKTISKKENIFQAYVADPVANFKDMVIDSASKLIGDGETDSAPAKSKDITETIKKDSHSASLPNQRTEVSLPSPSSIAELEKSITSAAQECAQSYKSLTRVVKDYSDGVQRLIDHSFQEMDARMWTEIGRKQEEKQKLLHIAEAKIDSAMKLIDKMEVLLQDLTLPTQSEVRLRVVKNMNRTINEVLEIKKKVQNEITSSSVIDKYWKELEEARKYFFEELDNLIPNKDTYNRKLRLTDEELNLFLMYAYQKILYYQRELNKLEGSKGKQLNEALSKLKEKHEIVDLTVQVEIDKERRRLQEEFEKKELALLLDAKRRTRALVKLQSEAHYDILREAKLNKEEEMKRKFQRELENKIDELETEGKVNIASMVGRLKGYNDAIKKRLLEKKQVRDAQELWCACQTLRSAVELPRHTKPLVEQLKPLMKDVIDIIDSSEGDEFVKAVASTIPKVALDRGVYPKMTLKDRFLKVEQVASQLAQVDESSLTIPKLFVSWLQSFLIITNTDPITSNEIGNEPIDTSSFSTYDILHRARYWLDRGDFLQTLRYMNLLTGAPKAVAMDWIKEATILLETLQAADILLAHACAGSFSKSS